ncbi:MAG TPA: hypothetical protein VFH95_11380 [Candidatus Kapabacteria bacterium]|nr:hypothetical protein [Candidatus Kapabacteria bacterium]
MRTTLEEDVVLARITSKPRESETDATMQDWKASKLLFPSTICLAKLGNIILHSCGKEERRTHGSRPYERSELASPVCGIAGIETESELVE